MNNSAKKPITRKFAVRYQLGARGAEHETFKDALQDLKESIQAANYGGDEQAIYLVVTEYRDGMVLGYGELTEEERALISY